MREIIFWMEYPLNITPKGNWQNTHRKIGFIFQNYNLIPVLTVWENIIFPITLDGRKPDQKFIMEIVQLLGLDSKLDSLPNNLSGGQQQRVAIARALASKPAIILADETHWESGLEDQ